jgi:hypothetical protein
MNEHLDARLWDQNGSKGHLEAAMARGEWELAALYIIAGFFEAASKLPEGALEDALDMLSVDDLPRRRYQRRRGGRRHGRA